MKYVFLDPDGAADYPVDELGGLTPLEAADTPNLDRLAREGRGGTVQTIPEGMGAGSDIATLSLMGYDPREYYTGRGPLEAAYRGIRLKSGEFAYRCNLITERDGLVKDYSAGHITSEDATVLIETIDQSLGNESIRFFPGVSYRHLLILKKGGSQETFIKSSESANINKAAAAGAENFRFNFKESPGEKTEAGEIKGRPGRRFSELRPERLGLVDAAELP